MASGSKNFIYAALAGNTLIAVMKFLAAFFTGSSAMLSEGIHSAVDTGNQILLLYGMKRAKKPPDKDFPFGHGKEIYFWSFIVAILIFAVGAGLSIFEGIHHIIHPNSVLNPKVSYIVLVLAMAFEGAAWIFALREFAHSKGRFGYIEAVKRGKNPSLFVVLFEDSAAMLGLLVAFLGIYVSQATDNPNFDGIASIIIGLILGGTAIWLAHETKGLLIGESANKEIRSSIRQILQSYKETEQVNEILTLHMGPDFILANISVDFNDSLSAGDIETLVHQIDSRIKRSHPEVKRVFIEPEARRPREITAGKQPGTNR